MAELGFQPGHSGFRGHSLNHCTLLPFNERGTKSSVCFHGYTRTLEDWSSCMGRSWSPPVVPAVNKLLVFLLPHSWYPVSLSWNSPSPFFLFHFFSSLTLFLILAFLIPSHASGLSECKWPCPKPNIKLTKTYLGPNTILSYVAANRLFPLSQFPCLKWRCWARLCKKEKNTLTMSLDNSGGNQEHFFSP